MAKLPTLNALRQDKHNRQSSHLGWKEALAAVEVLIDQVQGPEAEVVPLGQAALQPTLSCLVLLL